MVVGNKGQNNRRPNKEQYKRKANKIRRNARPRADNEPCSRNGRAFAEGNLKNCPARGKSCKNCNKYNHFAKICRAGHKK